MNVRGENFLWHKVAGKFARTPRLKTRRRNRDGRGERCPQDFEREVIHGPGNQICRDRQIEPINRTAGS